jgi:nitrate reductase gamma subunit
MNIFLITLTYAAVVFFFVTCAVRVVKIARLPVHLRWELAPLPLKKDKSGTNRHPQKSLAAIVIYMAREIFFQFSVWKNNRTLWPFSLSMHLGIFLVILSALINILNAILIIAAVPTAVVEVFQRIVAVVAIISYIVGCVGVIGLILKRVFDKNLRPFSSFVTYFRLIFLAAVFASGIAAWFSVPDFSTATSEFVHNVFTLNTGFNVAVPLVVHIIISVLFLIYLPLTDMIHFMTKFFLYHAVRWNDEPQDKKMLSKLKELSTQTLSWSAPHAPTHKNWTQLAVEKQSHEKKT